MKTLHELLKNTLAMSETIEECHNQIKDLKGQQEEIKKEINSRFSPKDLIGQTLTVKKPPNDYRAARMIDPKKVMVEDQGFINTQYNSGIYDRHYGMKCQVFAVELVKITSTELTWRVYARPFKANEQLGVLTINTDIIDKIEMDA